EEHRPAAGEADAPGGAGRLRRTCQIDIKRIVQEPPELVRMVPVVFFGGEPPPRPRVGDVPGGQPVVGPVGVDLDPLRALPGTDAVPRGPALVVTRSEPARDDPGGPGALPGDGGLTTRPLTPPFARTGAGPWATPRGSDDE